MKWIAIAVASIVAVLSAFYFMTVLTQPTWEGDSEVVERTRADTFAVPFNCNRITERALGQMKTHQRCREDADCTIQRLQCPFGCEVALNAKYEKAVLDGVQEYFLRMKEADCGTCKYRCPIGQNSMAQCVDSRCVVVDIGLPPGT